MQSLRARTARRTLAVLGLLGGLSLPAEPSPVYRVRDLSVPGGSRPEGLIDVEGTLFYAAGTGPGTYELWKSDGTAAGTQRVSTLALPLYPMAYTDRQYASFQGRLYFAASDGASGQELWMSDGTQGGTVLVKDINPGAAGSRPCQLKVMGNQMFFNAETATEGRELWKTDGTSAGTVLVRDIAPGPASSLTAATATQPLGARVVFGANSGGNHSLWTSDGTAAGTVPLANVSPGPSFAGPHTYLPAGNQLFFRAIQGGHGAELWRTDGTTGGTSMVLDLAPGPASSNPNVLEAPGGLVFFNPAYEGGRSANELWRTDPAGATVMLADIYNFSMAFIRNAVALNDALLFTAYNPTHGFEIWKSDGTPVGTGLLRDIEPGSSSSYPAELVEFQGLVFFAVTPVPREALWRTDGTAPGTLHVAVADGSNGFYPPRLLTPSGNRLFMASGPLGARELWALLPMDVPENVTLDEPAAGPAQAVATVSLAAASDRVVTVDYTTQDGTATAGVDYTATAGTLTFAPGVTRQDIHVTVFGDVFAEADETFSVVLSNPSNAYPRHDRVTVTIADDDAPGLAIGDVYAREGQGGSVSAAFTVRLFPPGGAPVTVDYASADGTASAGSDYTAVAGTLTFAAGETVGTIPVPVLADGALEGPETFTVILSGAAGAAIARSTGTGRILDRPRGADFNRDRRSDLLWRHDVSGQNVAWFMNGVDLVSGTFTDPASLPDPGWRIVGTNDFNADGQADLLWRHGGLRGRTSCGS